ncbi:hypothetical protein HYH03_017331 [Edaphochlamys debaryana]|uniref:Protein NEOXANTHIN-DEFICIENT 1 n=1 Tax=Edaphochlamys debaryana TaxID=47281 RepID=A0A836BQP3_9CHLO|nr:hypothetical protein HYH03_017331 [Edaphochlamys debaryana]|eukprot:KAG2483808.1 hypothetical protein HYH03_017331 [Edaphochlamys debaryana]
MVYANPPWIFKGKALYQLQLVKSDEARKYIPDNFKLVELFGYTLGGFYLARYDDSPAGTFDELVAMAGLVWNPPTSCAWAARVYVNNKEARDHGIHHVGLPSRLASFALTSGSGAQGQGQQLEKRGGWWKADGPKQQVLELSNVDPRRGRGLSAPVCRIELPWGERALGPRIKLPLPSFSGGTQEVPGLLQYACDLSTHVGLVAPLRVSVPAPGRGEEESPECLAAVLGGKPLVAIEFAAMEMRVEEPVALTLAQPQAQQQKGWASATQTASLTTAWGARSWGARRPAVAC